LVCLRDLPNSFVMLLLIISITGLIHSGFGHRVAQVVAQAKCKLPTHPAVPTCPGSGQPTCVSSAARTFAMEWTHDTDMDDLADLWDDDSRMPVSYHLINNLLIYLHYEDAGALHRFTRHANDLKEYTGKADDDIRNALIENIAGLHSSLSSYPIAAFVGVQCPIKLYHGEKFPPMLDELSRLVGGQDFALPAFMSTSLLEDVAYRFTSMTNPVVLEITVPLEELDHFRYTYFGQEIDLARTNTIKETELLLDLRTVLTFHSMQVRPKVTFSKYSPSGRVVSDTLLNVKVFHFTFKSHFKGSLPDLQSDLRSKISAQF